MLKLYSYSRDTFGFNNTPEVIIGSIIRLGARWVVKKIKFIKFYTQTFAKHE